MGKWVWKYDENGKKYREWKGEMLPAVIQKLRGRLDYLRGLLDKQPHCLTGSEEDEIREITEVLRRYR